MNKVMKRIAPVVAVLGMVVISSCSSVGPLTLNLAPSQAFSGANRTMESAADLSNIPNTSNVEYKIFGDLSTPRVSGFAFSIGTKPDAKDWLRNIAAALNVPGDVIKESKNTFTIGLNKETGAGVWLWVDDAGSWWSYFPGNTSATTASPCTAGPDCSAFVPAKPNNLLPADEAVARATRFLIQVGFSLSGFRLDAKKSDYSTDVTGNLVVSGIPTNLNFSFSYGEDGKLLSASGPLVTIRIANGYYIIPPKDGVERLSSSRYSAIGASANSAVDYATVPPGSPNAKKIVPITRVEYTLMQSVLANATTILLPAYTYYNEDGVVGTAIAMKDKYLMFGQMPVNTDEPAPLNTAERAGGSGGTSAASNPPIVLPTPESVRLLVGLAENGAIKVAQGNGWDIRIAMRDGEAFQLTADYSDRRVNLTVVKGIVSAVSIG